jgi:predicted restriction endonuclease
MSIADINDRQHILSAIAECKSFGDDEAGRKRFLEEYGFGQARSYWLVHEGKRYDSKAILGVAHKYARPDFGALKAADFSGGLATVQAKLEQLGFTIVRDDNESESEKTSERLVLDRVYTREDLRREFGITDATLNTGVFRPKGTASIWLFVTEEKTADRTQYHDRLEEGVLHWQGQTSGRTDDLIIGHRDRGLEILLFLRKRKYEFPGAGFRYAGRFQYEAHTGSNPTSFTLRRLVNSAAIPPTEADNSPFDPKNIADARERISRTIAQRRGQKAFRDALIAAYDGRCAITGCDVLDVLEAAHIHPYRGPETNKVVNGLLLRADLHTLFDCALVDIDPETLTVIVAPSLRRSEYGALHGQALRAPRHSSQSPSREALKIRQDRSA